MAYASCNALADLPRFRLPVSVEDDVEEEDDDDDDVDGFLEGLRPGFPLTDGERPLRVVVALVGTAVADAEASAAAEGTTLSTWVVDALVSMGSEHITSKTEKKIYRPPPHDSILLIMSRVIDGKKQDDGTMNPVHAQTC